MSTTLLQTRRRRYTDLDLVFAPHPVTKDAAKKIDDEAVKQSIKALVLMSQYDKPFHPEIYSGVQSVLFEPATPFTAAAMQSRVENILKRYETRVDQVNVSVSLKTSKDGFDVGINYRIIGEASTRTISFPLERIR